MNKTYDELQQENINLKNECEKKDNQIKILKEKTLIYHSCKTLMDENTALKQQLDISVEALDKIHKAINSNTRNLPEILNIVSYITSISLRAELYSNYGNGVAITKLDKYNKQNN